MGLSGGGRRLAGLVFQSAPGDKFEQLLESLKEALFVLRMLFLNEFLCLTRLDLFDLGFGVLCLCSMTSASALASRWGTGAMSLGFRAERLSQPGEISGWRPCQDDSLRQLEERGRCWFRD